MRFFLLIFCLNACSTLGANSTATPPHPEEREAIYTAISGENLLTITLRELSLLGDSSETQILAVLADGEGNVAYVLYPSNQPGITDTQISLNDYPLQLETSTESVSLWVTALRHHAYPVAARIGMSEIAAELATVFNRLVAGGSLPTRSPSAAIVAQADEAILDWFGEIEILGEAAFSLSTTQDMGEHDLESPDGGFRLRYFLSRSSESVLAETTIPTSVFPDEYSGYRKVIDETFAGNLSDLQWFTDREEEYIVELSNQSYEVDLLKLDETSESVISWGSIQDLVFDDYIVRAQMRLVQPNTNGSLGLWLHYLDGNHFLSFALNHLGQYRVMRYENRDVELTPWTAAAAINPGGQANMMEVRLRGNEYTLFINGTAMTSVNDDAYENGRIAFYCYAEEIPATCRLESLEVWIPEGQPYPMPTPTAAAFDE
ncbi:MAG: DUF1080 domain-containing protein [Anaerolineae bacterium]|nr:DUF1080 domain-containing protein [Anaerolineae bacterium]